MGVKSKHETVRAAFQFSLGSFFLLLFVLTPIFISIPEVAAIVTRRGRQGGGIAMLFVSFIYPGLLLVARDVRRGCIGKGRYLAPFYQCIVRGACYGMLFFLLFFMPIAVAEIVFIYHGMLLGVFLGYLLLGAPIFGAIGAGSGCAVGLFLKFWQRKHSQTNKASNAQMDSGHQPFQATTEKPF